VKARLRNRHHHFLFFSEIEGEVKFSFSFFLLAPRNALGKSAPSLRMCGRSSFVLSPEEVEALYTRVASNRNATTTKKRPQQRGEGGSEERHRLALPLDLDPLSSSSYRRSPNVAPTSTLPVLSIRGDSNDDADGLPFLIEIMKWGIATNSLTLPLVINARSETAASSPFSRLLSSARGRGVVAADGYYEWEAKSKQPYFVYRRDGAPMLLAVLVERKGRGGGRGGKNDGEQEQEQKQKPCFVILTRSPPKALRWLHDRCPCILPNDETAREWLSLGSGEAAREASAELLSRAGALFEGEEEKEEKKQNLSPLLSWHPVTKEIGRTSYQRADASKDVRHGGIASLFGKAREKQKEEVEVEVGEEEEEEQEQEEEEKKEIPSCLPPSTTLHSGVKRTPNQMQLLQPSKKAKKAVAPLDRGQRSLDSYLSPKKEEEKP